MKKSNPEFNFDNSYAHQLEGFYVYWTGEKAPTPEIVLFNDNLAEELGLDSKALNSDKGAAIFSGSIAPEGAAPLAQAYAGHQFGGFSEQLGDGRALLLGEVLDKDGVRYDLQLKGSGPTPFSRGGDGKAVLGPVLREYLMGEAMHALGVPTTRALAAVTTGEEIMREGVKPGAVLARVASSHLRVGTFQFFAARNEWEKVRKLADYTIERHYPELKDDDQKYLSFLSTISDRQAAVIAAWLQVGFVHGVMNTDNMSISGETIDYGPCAFLDAYDPKAVYSSIDHHGRYAFGNQPAIAQWNLARLAETLLPLIDPENSENAIRLATEVINGFMDRYKERWTTGMRSKIGIASQEDDDAALIREMFSAMEGEGVDYTLFFRHLVNAAHGQDEQVLALFNDRGKISSWLSLWRDRLLRDPQSPDERAKAMNMVNPAYIPRNHLVEEALEAAETGDMVQYRKLLDVLSNPFTKRDGLEDFEMPAPRDFGPYKTFCGT